MGAGKWYCLKSHYSICSECQKVSVPGKIIRKRITLRVKNETVYVILKLKPSNNCQISSDPWPSSPFKMSMSQRMQLTKYRQQPTQLLEESISLMVWLFTDVLFTSTSANINQFSWLLANSQTFPGSWLILGLKNNLIK